MDNTFAPRGCIRGPILPRFVLTIDMSPGAKTIYAILCDIAADKDHCWPSHARLAELLHCSVSSVKNWLRELVTHKLIAIRRNAARTSTYYMLKPSMLQASGAAFIGKAQEANFTSCQTKFAYRKNFKKDSILPPTPPTQAAGSSSLALTFPRPRPCRGDGGDFSLADSSFEQFCQRYPRKEAKELARAVWHRLWRRGSLPGLDVLFQSLIRFRESLSWQREHGRFIPLLVNWLRGQRWLDDLQPGGKRLYLLRRILSGTDVSSSRRMRWKNAGNVLSLNWRQCGPYLSRFSLVSTMVNKNAAPLGVYGLCSGGREKPLRLRMYRRSILASWSFCILCGTDFHFEANDGKQEIAINPRYGRVEFLAVKDEVESLLARGYLLKPAYAQLTKEKRISMTYDTFHRYARKYFPGGKNEQAGKLKRTDTRSKNSPGAVLPPSPAAPAKSPRTTSDGPRMIVPQNKSFQDSSVPDVADLLQVSKEEE